MVRPKDLPQPVRDHKPHDSLGDSSRAAASPGPCAYDGYGVTVFAKSRKLGFIPQARRFRYSTEPSLGPIYNPQLPSSSGGVTLKGSRDSKQIKTPAPGPGEYTINQSWEGAGVSFTQGKRAMFGIASDAPAPGTYNPVKLRIRNAPSAFFGSSARASGITGPEKKDCDPPITSLEAMDSGLSATRPQSAQIGFAKSKRSDVCESDPRLGPGSYDITAAAKHVDRSVHGVVFGAAPVSRASVEVAPPIPAPPPLNASSQKLASPAISFPKASYVRGLPTTAAADNRPEGSSASSIRPPMANVSFSQVDPSSKVVAWRPASSTGRGSRAQMTPGPGAFEIKSSIGSGPQIGFTRGTRSAGARRDPSPGPAAYNVSLPRRPESAAQSFPRAKRTGLPVPGEREAVPGPKYTPVDTPKAGISFPKERRDGRPMTAVCGSLSASYSPTYSHVDKNPHGAILYLTG
jgi:hypothetical protein